MRRKTKNISSINPSNDRFMIDNGLRPHHLDIDRSVFSKSAQEKQKLKELKKKQW